MKGAAALLAGALCLIASGCRARANSPEQAEAKAAASASAALAVTADAHARDAAAEDAAPDAEPAPRGPLNVLLILIDSLRYDMPWNGYSRPIAPFLTEYEKRVVSYTRAYTISSTTARSVAPMLAGRYPSEMRRGGYFFTQWHPDNELLPERLAEEGHARFGVFAHTYFHAGTGVVQGLDPAKMLSGTVLNNLSPKHITSERIALAARKLMSKPKIGDQSEGRRFFGYLHFMDPHAPYLAHEGRPSWGNRPRDLYDQEVHFTDEHVGKLITWIKQQPFGKDTAIIITADHGESFGEHGHLKHGYELWEELVRVPLFIDVPGAKPRRIDTPRSHIDLRRTILELMNVSETADTRGKSLVPELFGAEPEPRVVVCDLPRDNLQDRRRAVIDGRYKMIGIGDDRRLLYFDVVADPGETKRLNTEDPEGFERMRRVYEAVDKDIPVRDVSGDDPPLFNAPAGRRW